MIATKAINNPEYDNDAESWCVDTDGDTSSGYAWWVCINGVWQWEDGEY